MRGRKITATHKYFTGTYSAVMGFLYSHISSWWMTLLKGAAFSKWLKGKITKKLKFQKILIKFQFTYKNKTPRPILISSSRRMWLLAYSFLVRPIFTGALYQWGIIHPRQHTISIIHLDHLRLRTRSNRQSAYCSTVDLIQRASLSSYFGRGSYMDTMWLRHSEYPRDIPGFCSLANV